MPRANCTVCGKRVRVRPGAVGKRVRCRTCAHAIAGKPVTPRPTKARRWLSRRVVRRVLVAAAAAAALTLAGAVGYGIGLEQGRGDVARLQADVAQAEQDARQQTERAAAEADRLRAEADRLAGELAAARAAAADHPQPPAAGLPPR